MGNMGDVSNSFEVNNKSLNGVQFFYILYIKKYLINFMDLK